MIVSSCLQRRFVLWYGIADNQDSISYHELGRKNEITLFLITKIMNQRFKETCARQKGWISNYSNLGWALSSPQWLGEKELYDYATLTPMGKMVMEWHNLTDFFSFIIDPILGHIFLSSPQPVIRLASQQKDRGDIAYHG